MSLFKKTRKNPILVELPSIVAPSLRFLPRQAPSKPPSVSNSSLPRLISSKPAVMPTYIVTCNDNASPEQIAQAKKHATDQGGKIGHEYSLIKGFSVSFPDGAVVSLDSNEHVKHVEQDQKVSTQ